jgi:hypothetical protein
MGRPVSLLEISAHERPTSGPKYFADGSAIKGIPSPQTLVGKIGSCLVPVAETIRTTEPKPADYAENDDQNHINLLLAQLENSLVDEGAIRNHLR